MPKWMRLFASDTTVMSVVGLNAFVLFLDAFPSVHARAGTMLGAIDYLCIIYFVVEAVIKLGWLERRRYFRSGWNWFDFVIVAASTPVLLVPFGLPVHNLAGLLVLRLARLLRFLKLLKFIPNINRLFEGALRALRSSVAVLMLTLFYLFTFGIAATYFFGDPSSPAGGAFSDPFMSMYTMFKVFTVEGWYEMGDALGGDASTIKAHLIRLFFITAVVVGGIIILSLLNAVFVDEMSNDLAEQTEDELDAIQERLASMEKQLGAELAEIRVQLAQIGAQLKPDK